MAGDGVAGEGEGDLTRFLETVELEPGKNGAGVCTNERVAIDVGTGSVSVTVFSESDKGSVR